MSNRKNDVHNWKHRAESRYADAVSRSQKQAWLAKAVQVYRAEMILCSMEPPSGMTIMQWTRLMGWLCRMASRAVVQEEDLKKSIAKIQEIQPRIIILEKMAELVCNLELSENNPEHTKLLQILRVYKGEFCVDIYDHTHGLDDTSPF